MFFRKRLKFVIRVILPALFVFITLIVSQPSAQTIDIPTPQQKNNPTIIENKKIGTTEWQLTNPAIQREIEGYASLTSVNRGEEIKFFVNTKEPSYTIEIFRMGWYGGAGGRQMASAIKRTAVKQPLPIVTQATGLIECNWRDPYILTIPNNPNDPTQWMSGFYLAKLTASKSSKQSYIIFVVRDDSRPSDILFQSSVTTYQAYNNWGGMSLYRWNSRGKQASKVSFNRPYAASPNRLAAYGIGAGEFLTNVQPKRRTSSAGWEYNMVRWLEREGYDVTYSTDIDTHNNLIEVQSSKPMLWLHKAFLSVGHDEYWSWQMRQNVQTAREQGVSLGFFSSNTCYWQIRFEPSLITREINRTIVAYKEGVDLDPFTRDNNPKNDYLVTTLWRNKPVNLPEDALLGVMFETFQVNADILIDSTAPDWLLAGTQLNLNEGGRRQKAGGRRSKSKGDSTPPDLKPLKKSSVGVLNPCSLLSQLTLRVSFPPASCPLTPAFDNTVSAKANNKQPLKEIRLVGLLGYEVDRMFGNAPTNTVRIAHSPYKYNGSTRYSDMTIYTTKSGAKVFATGSMQWSWGLDDFNAPRLRPSVLNNDAQAMTRNILAQMINK